MTPPVLLAALLAAVLSIVLARLWRSPLRCRWFAHSWDRYHVDNPNLAYRRCRNCERVERGL
jgi:hypothetical protein